MKLNEILIQRESDILNTWLDSFLEVYPADTRRFLKKRRDGFENPVGHNLKKGTGELFKELLREGDVDPEGLYPILDGIIRVLAIQDFDPSYAIRFIFNLKKVIKGTLRKEIRDKDLYGDLMKFEEKIDEAALMAFDIYMKCREKIYEITANHAKNQVSSLLRKSGLISEIPEWDPNKPERRLA